MEGKTTPSLYGNKDEGRGAGGKLGKPAAKKNRAGPYDRPPSNQQNRAGGWLSKLVDPAYRLVAGGATKILPSLFSKSPFAAALPLPTEIKDKLDEEVIPMVMRNANGDANGDEKCSSTHDVPRIMERIGPSEAATDKLKGNCESEECGQRPKNFDDDSQISRIEQLIKGKAFSRDEINRLTDILISRVGGEKGNEDTTISGHTEGVLLTPFSRTSDEGNQGHTKRAILRTPAPVDQSSVTVQDEVGASPMDIAKAYMGSRISELGPSPYSTYLKGETAPQTSNELALKPFIPSSSHKSSTAWPGTMVQDQHGYVTPSQRCRYGLHDFPRTPYSKTIYSKSRAKLTHLQADSRYLNTSSPPFQQVQTPIFGQVKSQNDVLDDSYESIGPIRRIRNKFASEARPRGSIFLNNSKGAPSTIQQSSVSKGILPTLVKGPGDHAGNRFEETAPLLNPFSSQAVKRILEQLDRTKPTPKEKAAELKLAASWKKSPSEGWSHLEEFGSLKKTDFVDPKLLSEGDKSKGNSNSQVRYPDRSIAREEAMVTSAKSSRLVIGDSVTKNDVNAGSLLGLTSNPVSQIKRAQQEGSMGIRIVEKESSSNSLLQKQSNGRHVTTVTNESNFELTKKLPPHASGSKPVLPYISVSRQGASRAVSSDTGVGFTFPVSSSLSILSEPPTPSVMPFSSSNMVSHPEEEPTAPSYSFSTKKSALVFSFPSTSSAPAHADSLDLNFNFGSDKKSRLSFGSVGKDAICY